MIPQISARPRPDTAGVCAALVLVTTLGACSASRPAMTRYVWMPAAGLEPAADSVRLHAPVTADWIDGAAARIATPLERERFGALGSDEEREKFVEAFWARRDPDPESRTNEFRQEFERRARAADAVFSTDDRPGSTTVFGLALLVFGYPYAVSVNPHDKGGVSARDSLAVPTRVHSGDEITWRYVPEGLAAPAAGSNQLHFVQFGYVRGAWRMICGAALADHGWALNRWRVAPNPDSGFGGGGTSGSGSGPVNYGAYGLAASSSGGSRGYRGGGLVASAMASSIAPECFDYLLRYGGVAY